MKNLELILAIMCITVPTGGSFASSTKANKGYPRILAFIKKKFNDDVPTGANFATGHNEVDANHKKQQAAPPLIRKLEDAREELGHRADSHATKVHPEVAATSHATAPGKAGSSCEFAVVIASFNNEKYFEENLNSVCFQNSTNPYHIYYINDCSTDATGKLVEDYIKKNGLMDKVTLINNDVNIGAGANIYNTIHKYIADHKIVVLLDGDDLFPHNDVLLTLESYYKDSDIWMTYGSVVAYPSGESSGWGMSQEMPISVFHDKKIREYPFVAQHLKTFKAALFKKIKLKSFYYKGEFMKVTHDLVYMLAMLEMASPKNKHAKNHSAFVKEVLYLYRNNTPLNDFRVRKALVLEVEEYVRSLKPYKPIESLELSQKKS